MRFKEPFGYLNYVTPLGRDDLVVNTLEFASDAQARAFAADPDGGLFEVRPGTLGGRPPFQYHTYVILTVEGVDRVYDSSMKLDNDNNPRTGGSTITRGQFTEQEFLERAIDRSVPHERLYADGRGADDPVGRLIDAKTGEGLAGLRKRFELYPYLLQKRPSTAAERK